MGGRAESAGAEEVRRLPPKIQWRAVVSLVGGPMYWLITMLQLGPPPERYIGAVTFGTAFLLALLWLPVGVPWLLRIIFYPIDMLLDWASDPKRRKIK